MRQSRAKRTRSSIAQISFSVQRAKETTVASGGTQNSGPWNLAAVSRQAQQRRVVNERQKMIAVQSQSIFSPHALVSQSSKSKSSGPKSGVVARSAAGGGKPSSGKRAAAIAASQNYRQGIAVKQAAHRIDVSKIKLAH